MKKRYTMILPVDTLVLLSVVIILLLTLAFSLGVERGRKIALRKQKKQQTVSTAQPQKESISNVKKEMKAPEPITSFGDEEEGEEIVVARFDVPQTSSESAQVGQDLTPSSTVTGQTETEASSEAEAGPRYRIQVATYLKQDMAQLEADRLNKKGFPTIIEQKGKFVVLFVGEFSSKEDANRNLTVLKDRYADCFVRRL